jgi:uncharacterized protein YbgA (DUF1722 family)/uncharacterized protein YbbK (DUF523 family)
MTARSRTPILIGISSCLLGQKVRYDGGHKHDPFLTDTVGKFVTFVPFCPEMEIGLGAPRESIHLTSSSEGVRLVGVKSGRDLTDLMRTYAEKKASELERKDLSGAILKSNSPSCGMERVRIHGEAGPPARNGRGLFAQGLMEKLPRLPVEEEGRLNDPALRENFFERVFAYRRSRDFFSTDWGVGDLVAFHTREKLLVMAHAPAAYVSLGRLVALAKGQPRADLAARYETDLMEALKTPATARRHTNVLQHMAGYFKKLLTADEKQELAGVIEDFRLELLPLVAPLTLMRHHARRFQTAYLLDQSYVDPHPKELMLRNHV